MSGGPRARSLRARGARGRVSVGLPVDTKPAPRSIVVTAATQEDLHKRSPQRHGRFGIDAIGLGLHRPACAGGSRAAKLCATKRRARTARPGRQQMIARLGAQPVVMVAATEGSECRTCVLTMASLMTSHSAISRLRRPGSFRHGVAPPHRRPRRFEPRPSAAGRRSARARSARRTRRRRTRHQTRRSRRRLPRGGALRRAQVELAVRSTGRARSVPRERAPPAGEHDRFAAGRHGGAGGSRRALSRETTVPIRCRRGALDPARGQRRGLVIAVDIAVPAFLGVVVWVLFPPAGGSGGAGSGRTLPWQMVVMSCVVTTAIVLARRSGLSWARSVACGLASFGTTVVLGALVLIVALYISPPS